MTKKNKKTIRSVLKNKLNKQELAIVPSSFDIIGNREKAVAIIELNEKLLKKKEKAKLKKIKKLVASALMKKHKNVKAVLCKKSARKGVFRVREYELIAGNKNTEVMHKESGCRFLLDPRHVYFSTREGTERLRIANKIKKGTVMVFFAGVGPLPIIIAKKQPWIKKIYAIEINPVAVRYFRENVRLNKIEKNKIHIIHGDVKNRAKSFYRKCDRVIMPLPESAHKYLEEAILCLRKNGIIYFYCFAKEDEMNKWKNKIRKSAKKLGKEVKFIDVKKVLPFGPRVWKMRIDFIIQ